MGEVCITGTLKESRKRELGVGSKEFFKMGENVAHLYVDARGEEIAV